MTEQDFSLSEILSDAPIPDAPSTEPTKTTPEPAADTGQPRGPDGKFAPKASEPPQPEQPTPQQPATPPTEDQPGAMVPLAALHAERQKGKALETRLEEMAGQLALLTRQVTQPAQPAPVQQEAPKPKDFWEAPESFVKDQLSAVLTPVQQELRDFIFEVSKQNAEARYGAEKVSSAYDALKAAVQRGEVNPREVEARLSASRNPVGDVVAWYERHSAIQRVGNDPDAWLQAELEKMIADPTKAGELLAKIQQRTTGAPAVIPPSRSNPAPTPPPTLSRIPGGHTEPGVPSLGDILKGG